MAYQTLQQVAERFHVHPDTVKRWVRAGRLAELRVGKVRRFSPDDVEAFEARHRQEREAS
jgi:excisionase family DNA binding protein